MAKFAQLQTDFSGGMVDSQAIMRTDVDAAYNHGANELDNWHVHIQGGIARRRGMRFNADIAPAASETPVRIVPFEFDEQEVYAFVFCTDGLRIYGDANQDGTFELVQTLTEFTHTADILEALTYTQANDVMLVCMSGQRIRKITRTAIDTFTVEDWDVAALPPENGQAGGLSSSFNKFAPSEWRMVLSYISAPNGDNVYIPGSTATLTSVDGNYFEAGHVGLVMALGPMVVGAFPSAGPPADFPYQEGDVYWAQYVITSLDGINPDTVANVTALDYVWTGSTTGQPPDSNDGILAWGEQSWSDLRGWPRCVEFHAGRLWFASTASLPNWLWGSAVGRYDIFEQSDGADDHPIAVPIDSDKVNRIRHLLSARDLQIYTDQAEFFVSGSVDRPITPATISVNRVSNYGSGDIAPEVFDQATLFTQRGGSVARQLVWNDLNQGYQSDPLSLLVETLVTGIVRQAAWYGGLNTQEEFAFLVRDDGDLAVMHASRAQNVSGWSRWTTDGVVVDVAIVGRVPFFVVQRDINGAKAYYLECLCNDLLSDSSLLLDPDVADTPQSVWSGLDHLEAEVVHVAASFKEADGSYRQNAYYLGEYTVTGGQVDISDLYEDVFEQISVGLAFTSRMKSLPAELSVSGFGSLTNRRKRIPCVTAHIDSTLAFSIEGKRLIARNVNDDMSEPPPQVTGPRRFYILGAHLRNQFELVNELPLPCNVLAFTQEIAF